jgi:antitoxin VapB
MLKVPPSSDSSPRRISLFKNGRNQALRIPRDLELPTKEATIVRDGRRLIIEPLEEEGSLLGLLAELPPIEESLPDVDATLGAPDAVQL